jgi:hypothetical protein
VNAQLTLRYIGLNVDFHCSSGDAKRVRGGQFACHVGGHGLEDIHRLDGELSSSMSREIIEVGDYV